MAFEFNILHSVFTTVHICMHTQLFNSQDLIFNSPFYLLHITCNEVVRIWCQIEITSI